MPHGAEPRLSLKRLVRLLLERNCKTFGSNDTPNAYSAGDNYNLGLTIVAFRSETAAHQALKLMN